VSLLSDPDPSPPRDPLRLGLQVLVVALATLVSDILLVPFHLAPESWIVRVYVLVRMVALVALATLFLRSGGESWRSVGFARPNRLRWLLAWVFGGYLATALVAGTVGAVLVRQGGFPMPNPERALHAHPGLLQYLYWIVPVTWGAAAFGEELLFRGFFLTRFLGMLPPARWGVILAVVMQAAIFGLLHLYQGVVGAAMAGVIGLVLACVYLLSGRNLWAGILLHGTIDSISVTVLYLRLANG